MHRIEEVLKRIDEKIEERKKEEERKKKETEACQRLAEELAERVKEKNVWISIKTEEEKVRITPSFFSFSDGTRVPLEEFVSLSSHEEGVIREVLASLLRGEAKIEVEFLKKGA